jgi:hypothetical protein
VTTPNGRPAPLREIAAKWATVYSAGTAVVSGLLTAGVITAGQAGTVNDDFTAVDLLLSAIVALVAAGAATLSAFSTAKSGEAKVTPVSAPATTTADGSLVPLVPVSNTPPVMP